MCKIFAGIGIIVVVIIRMSAGQITGDTFQICISIGISLIAVGVDSLSIPS